MSSYPPTPNMGLVLPIPGTTEGPEYAQQQTQALRQVDEHDHTLGQGAPITPLALNINDDVTFNGNDAVDLRTTTFQSQESTLPDLQSTYVVGGDLYYNNSAGVPVPITSGNSLAAGSIGGIGGLNLPPQTAAVNYDPGTNTFTFTSAPGTAAVMDHGPVTVRPAVNGAFGITIEPDGSIVSDWTLTLPGAPPLTTKFLTIGNAGEISFGDADNTSLQNSSGTLSIKNGGVTRTKQSAVGQQLSSAVSIAWNATMSFTTITNMFVDITTTGRPIIIMAVPDDTSSPAVFRVTVGGGSVFDPGNVELRIAVTGSATANIGVVEFGPVVQSNIFDFPPGIYSHVYAPAAGTYRLSLQGRVRHASTFLEPLNMKLLAYEL